MKQSNLKVKVEKKSNCRVELQIEVASEIVKEAKKQALKELKKDISIPGFRKGKAPDDMVETKYSSVLKEKLEKKIADLSFIEAHKQEKIPSISSNSKIIFKIEKYSLEEGANLHFTYETEPQIPSIDPKAFNPKKQKEIKITQKQIDEAIRQIRFFHATWKEVDRPIQEGDYILIDLDALDHTPAQRVFSDTRFEVSDNGMAFWMKDLVLGAKKSDALEGISKPDETASEEEKKNFESKKVLVTIKKIEEATLPKLDDEFAKKVGSKTVQEMKDSIKNILTNQEMAKHNEENRKEVNKFLLETYKFDVPESLVKTEIQYRKNSYLQNPSFKKQYDKMSEKEKKDFEKDLLKHSEEAIRIFYLSRKIINDFKIPIPDNEIKQEALNILYKETGKKPDAQDIPKDLYALALSRLVLMKAEDYILDQRAKT